MSNLIVEYLRIQQPGQSPSPAGNWLNGKLIDAEPGEITVEFEVLKAMTNPVGTLHGGVLSLMADEVIGIATFSLNNEYMYTSINLVVDFLSSAKIGDTITAKASIVRKGRNVINVECLLTNQNGKLIGKASSNMARTPNKSLFYNN